jgi:hypothetical protein
MNENEMQSELENTNLKPLKSLFFLNEINDDLDTSDISNNNKIDYDMKKSKTIDANNNLGKLDFFNKKDSLETPKKKLVRKNTVYNFKDTCIIEKILDKNSYNEQIQEISNNEKYDSMYENKLNKSGFSLSELDNIKRKTIRNLKSYKRKFSTINIRVRKSIFNKINDLNKRPYFERLIRKNGDANIDRINIEKLHQRYILDIFNTMVDMRWRSILVLFVLSFLISWTFFASLWFFLDEQCVANVKADSFLDSFLFSIETQQTIGICII